MCCVANGDKTAAAVLGGRWSCIKPPQRQNIQQMVTDRPEVRVELVKGSCHMLRGCLTAHLVDHHSRYILECVEDEVEVLEIMAPVPQQVPLAVGRHAECTTAGDRGHDAGEGVLLQLGDGDHGADGRVAAPQGWGGLAEDDGHCGRVDAVGGDDEVCLGLRTVGQVYNALLGLDADHLRVSEEAAWQVRGIAITTVVRRWRFCHTPQLLPQVRPIDCAAYGFLYLQDLQQLQCSSIEDL